MRQANSNARLVTVFGGSGFLGRHVVRALAKRGYRIRVAVRRPDLAGHLQPLGGVGQIMPVQANVRYPASVDRAVAGADAVINLVGILSPWGRQTFEGVQAFGARAIAKAAASHNVSHVVHVSAIGADTASASRYAATKGEGEAAMRAAFPDTIIFRPSIVFGPEDDFFNRFASLSRFLPFLPLIGGGTAKFQPVYVADVAEAIALAVDGKLAAGGTYELGGPEQLSMKEIYEKIFAATGRKRLMLPLPTAIANVQASLFELLPKPMLTRDQVILATLDNVVSEAAIAEGRTLAGIGIDAVTVDAILPTYLYRFKEHGQYDVHSRPV